MHNIDNKITHIEATCPNCGQDMSIELPKLLYKLPYENGQEENFDKMQSLSHKTSVIKNIIEELYYISSHLKGWRDKKAKNKVYVRIGILEDQLMRLDTEYRNLYNFFNPIIGEHSTGYDSNPNK